VITAAFNSLLHPIASQAPQQEHQAAWYFIPPNPVSHRIDLCHIARLFSHVSLILLPQVSNPLDVIKTRLQTQGEIGGKLGIAQTIRLVYSEGGVGAFFRGLGARMLYHAPAAAFQMVTYEAVKVGFKWLFSSCP
jgi:hypothetical protein